MATCGISFDNRQREYIAGQSLRGTVRFVLKNDLEVRNVHVRVWGRAHAKHGNQKLRYKAKEDYLDEIVYLIRSSVHELVKIKAGEHAHNFEYTLSENLPSSCEGQLGHIRYFVNVVFDAPTGFSKKFEERFTVVKPLNLNHDFALRQPIVIENSEEFCPFYCLCCFYWRPRKLRITARTPTGGYVRCEPMHLDLDVKNDSNIDVHIFEVKLIQKIKYKMVAGSDECCKEERYFYYKTTVMKISIDGCPQFEEKSYQIRNVVPAIPTTDVDTSDVITLEYYIQITAGAPMWTCDYKFKIPIAIGTIPIQDSRRRPIPTAASSSLAPNFEQETNGNAEISSSEDASPKYKATTLLNKN